MTLLTGVIYGAGGHGKVVLDAALSAGTSVRWVVDRQPKASRLLGVAVVGDDFPEWLNLASFRFVVAIGENGPRARVFHELQDRGGQPVNVIHPRSTLSASVKLGLGVVVFAGAVINPEAVIGDNCIINTSASVDHDCILGDHVHLCPGVHLAGGVRVGAGTMVGIGAVVLPGVKIGCGCSVGAGAVVTKDLPDGVTAYGVPARVRRKAASFPGQL